MPKGSSTFEAFENCEPNELVWIEVIRRTERSIARLERDADVLAIEWERLSEKHFEEHQRVAKVNHAKALAGVRGRLMKRLFQTQHEILWIGEDEPGKLHHIMGCLGIDMQHADWLRGANLAGLLQLRDRYVELLEATGVTRKQILAEAREIAVAEARKIRDTTQREEALQALGVLRRTLH